MRDQERNHKLPIHAALSRLIAHVAARSQDSEPAKHESKNEVCLHQDLPTEPGKHI